MKTHVSSGGVLYNPQQKKVYLIYKTERDEWLLPKGHIEEDERVEETAIREIQEETGYKNIKLIDNGLLGKTEFEFKLNGEKAFKIVYYYLVELVSDDFNQTKEREQEGLDGKWLDFKEAIDLVDHDDIKKVLEKAVELTNN
jgi:8-oxo-dGTP pyrophosphatase MutT (NUDIX family)